MSQYYPPDDDQETRRSSEPLERRGPAGGISLPTRPQRRPAFAEEPPEPEESGLYVPWWGFALVILIVAGLTCGLWGLVLMTRGDASTGAGPTPTPIFVVITATPTPGPQGDGGGEAPPVTPTVTTPPLPTSQPGVTETPGLAVAISIGATIEVTGTGGDGLSVRQGPGVNFTFIFIANDGERFTVQDGPRDADGYIWWSIIDPADANRFGWAVENFMVVVQ